MTQQIDITPDTHVINSIKSSHMKWPVAIGELVDNSFDAGANRVELGFPGKRTFTCCDDGRGTNNIAGMFTIGRHTPSKSTRLGMYGVGLKDTSIWLFGLTTIRTVHSGVMRTAVVNWSHIERSGQWRIDAPLEESCGKPSGTLITFENITKNPPSNLNDLALDLGYRFFPAINEGRQIVITRPKAGAIPVRPYQLPPLDKTVDELIEVDGRKFHLRAGIVSSESQNRRPGFAIVYGHRVVMQSSVVDSSYSTSRIAGIVTLIHGWSITKNKDGMSDEDNELLSRIVTEKCRGILEINKQLESAIIGREFTEELNAEFARLVERYAGPERRREKRNATTNEGAGTVEAKGTPRKRQNAAKSTSQLGSVLERTPRGLRICYRAYGDTSTMGKFDEISKAVCLNETHPKIAAWRDDGNKEATLLIVCGILSYRASIEDKPLFKIERTDFMEVLAELMLGQCDRDTTIETLAQ